jgi:DNA polymerase-3 subunit delta
MVIFLYGPDTFRSREKLKTLKAKFVREIDKSGLNLAELDGKKLELQEIKKHVSALPFLAKKRMVIIQNLIAYKPSKQLQKSVIELLKDKSVTQTIIIFWEGELSGTETRSNLLFKKLVLEKYSYQFDLLTGWPLKQWYQKKIAELGTKITPAALNLLVDLVGNDLWQADSELKKLAAFCKYKTITPEVVKLLTKNKLEENIFMLTDALGQKNKKLALKLISDQLNLGTAPTELLAKMIWQFRNLLQVKDLLDDTPRLSSYQIASQLNLHPFVAKKTLGQIGNFQLDELKSIYQNLLEIDHQIKTSQGEPETLFNLLVVKS